MITSLIILQELNIWSKICLTYIGLITIIRENVLISIWTNESCKWWPGVSQCRKTTLSFLRRCRAGQTMNRSAVRGLVVVVELTVAADQHSPPLKPGERRAPRLGSSRAGGGET